VRFNGSTPGAARLHVVDGVALLRPEEQVFSAMLDGFANQQLARNLARSTVEGRENRDVAGLGVPADGRVRPRPTIYRHLAKVPAQPEGTA
jgi:hypothetical protein